MKILKNPINIYSHEILREWRQNYAEIYGCSLALTNNTIYFSLSSPHPSSLHFNLNPINNSRCLNFWHFFFLALPPFSATPKSEQSPAKAYSSENSTWFLWCRQWSFWRKIWIYKQEISLNSHSFWCLFFLLLYNPSSHSSCYSFIVAKAKKIAYMTTTKKYNKRSKNSLCGG